MSSLTVSRRLLAKPLVARSRRAKHPRQNPAPGRHPAKSEQAQSLVTKPAKISPLQAQAKLAARPAFSSTLAGKRCRQCFCAH